MHNHLIIQLFFFLFTRKKVLLRKGKLRRNFKKRNNRWRLEQEKFNKQTVQTRVHVYKSQLLDAVLLQSLMKIYKQKSGKENEKHTFYNEQQRQRGPHHFGKKRGTRPDRIERTTHFFFFFFIHLFIITHALSTFSDIRFFSFFLRSKIT